jgi:hypothetical protein
MIRFCRFLVPALALVSGLVACQGETVDEATTLPAGEAAAALGVQHYVVVGERPLGLDLVGAAGLAMGSFVSDTDALTFTDADGHVLDLDLAGHAPVFTRDGVPATTEVAGDALALLLAVSEDPAVRSLAATAPAPGLEQARQALPRLRCTDNANGTTTCCSRTACTTF